MKDASIKAEVNILPPYDRMKVMRLCDEACILACELEQETYDNKLLIKIATALQDLCLAIKEVNEPEELP